jgi:hypothetical protein
LGSRSTTGFDLFGGADVRRPLRGRDYRDLDVGIVAIGANDPVAYPEDSPESLAEEARKAGYAFPYLFDETQEVAKTY